MIITWVGGCEGKENLIRRMKAKGIGRIKFAFYALRKITKELLGDKMEFKTVQDQHVMNFNARVWMTKIFIIQYWFLISHAINFFHFFFFVFLIIKCNYFFVIIQLTVYACFAMNVYWNSVAHLKQWTNIEWRHDFYFSFSVSGSSVIWVLWSFRLVAVVVFYV